MGLFGSLYSSASGMLAASRATQVTSTNVANMTTTGYKKSETAFAEIVAESRFSSPTDSAGGVSTEKLLRATRQGQIQQTGSVTDASIIGNGFFAVKDTLDPDAGFLYTRNGQFSEFAVRTTDDTGLLTTENAGEETYLRNSAGFYLYGWPVDTDGTTLNESTSTDALEPLEVGLFQTQVLPTSRIDLSINLDADEVDINPHQLSPAQTLPVNAVSAADFNRSVVVYDTLGNPRQVDFEFRKVSGPMAQFSSDAQADLNLNDVLVDNATGPTPAITNGDIFQIGNGAGALTVTFVPAPADTTLNQANTLQDLRTVINNFQVAGQQQFEARIDDSGEFSVQSAVPSETIDLTGTSATVLGANGFNVITDPVNGNNIYGPMYDVTQPANPLGPYPGQDDFPALTNTTNPNTQGWWEVSVRIPDPAAPTSGNTVELRTGLMNFNGNGTLNADPANSIIDLGTTPIDFDTSTVGEESAITIDVSRFSQFSGEYNVLVANQNGAPTGERTGVSITDDGLVVADFSNGSKVPLYRIPLANFANADGLSEQSGTVFAESAVSGEVQMFAAGQNGAGLINGSTLEASNVDIAEEFGDLIVFQRSFGLNSRVINAVDEMTQNLVRLKQ